MLCGYYNTKNGKKQGEFYGFGTKSVEKQILKLCKITKREAKTTPERPKIAPAYLFYRCKTRSLISWVRPWFQYWVPM